MAKVFLICGRICSGKSTYAKKLAEAQNAVILSADEIMLAVFGQDSGQKHDVYVKRVRTYLYQKTSDAYFVDEGLEKKFEELFEPPQKDEIHVWVEG